MIPKIYNSASPQSHFEAPIGPPARPTGRTDGAGTAQLGNMGKCPATIEALNRDTGEVLKFQRDRKGNLRPLSTISSRRQERYTLQTHSGYILRDSVSSNGKGFAVGRCGRFLRGDSVQVLKTAGKAHYNGLVQCGSVWTCPVCAAKIAEERRLEIEQAVNLHSKEGLSVLMLTLTVPHYRSDALSLLLSAFHAALTTFRSQRSYKALMALNAQLGHIRALEVTYGQNGWHPHVHELHFFNKKLTEKDVQSLKDQIFKIWSKSCVHNGLPEPSKKHGVDLKITFSASEYLSKFGIDRKWGPGSELAKTHIKKGKPESFTPWDLLQKSYEARSTGSKDIYYKNFIDYAQNFHGKRQIVWSIGLKNHFQINERDDDACLASEIDSDTVLMTEIPLSVWHQHIAKGKVEFRGQILDYAEKNTSDALEVFIHKITMVKKHSYFWKTYLDWDGPFSHLPEVTIQ